MSNNNANIKRCRERLAKLKRAKETQDQEFACQDDISVEISHSENRVKIFYPDKPDLETRQNLKSSGFRWAPSEGCWKGYVNRNTLNFVKPIVAASMASKPAIWLCTKKQTFWPARILWKSSPKHSEHKIPSLIWFGSKGCHTAVYLPGRFSFPE